jgi:hypothetical protein
MSALRDHHQVEYRSNRLTELTYTDKSPGDGQPPDHNHHYSVAVVTGYVTNEPNLEHPDP